MTRRCRNPRCADLLMEMDGPFCPACRAMLSKGRRVGMIVSFVFAIAVRLLALWLGAP